MTAPFLDLIRAHSRLLQPISTDVRPRLQQLDGIRAILFDIYGTLLISASGDIGTNRRDAQMQAVAALIESSLATEESPETIVSKFENAIGNSHTKNRERGFPYPEVDIVNIWTEVLSSLEGAQGIDIRSWALEFELRTNPVWPMPGAADILTKLRESRFDQGLVSNAQFYTPLLIEALVGETTEELGFPQSVSIYSFKHLRGKPDTYLYEVARNALAEMEISADETLMVGNDMLNDIAASHRVGFRTALFAGDGRSLRMREDDERVAGIEPSIVITELHQLFECLDWRS